MLNKLGKYNFISISNSSDTKHILNLFLIAFCKRKILNLTSMLDKR